MKDETLSFPLIRLKGEELMWNWFVHNMAVDRFYVLSNVKFVD
jgi:hypothetical protein